MVSVYVKKDFVFRLIQDIQDWKEYRSLNVSIFKYSITRLKS